MADFYGSIVSNLVGFLPELGQTGRKFVAKQSTRLCFHFYMSKNLI